MNTLCLGDIVPKEKKRRKGSQKEYEYKNVENILTWSSKKHETWKTTWGFLTDIFGKKIKINLRKNSLMLNGFY